MNINIGGISFETKDVIAIREANWFSLHFELFMTHTLRIGAYPYCPNSNNIIIDHNNKNTAEKIAVEYKKYFKGEREFNTAITKGIKYAQTIIDSHPSCSIIMADRKTFEFPMKRIAILQEIKKQLEEAGEEVLFQIPQENPLDISKEKPCKTKNFGSFLYSALSFILSFCWRLLGRSA